MLAWLLEPTTRLCVFCSISLNTKIPATAAMTIQRSREIAKDERVTRVMNSLRGKYIFGDPSTGSGFNSPKNSALVAQAICEYDVTTTKRQLRDNEPKSRGATQHQSESGVGKMILHTCPAHCSQIQPFPMS